MCITEHVHDYENKKKQHENKKKQHETTPKRVEDLMMHKKTTPCENAINMKKEYALTSTTEWDPRLGEDHG